MCLVSKVAVFLRYTIYKETSLPYNRCLFYEAAFSMPKEHSVLYETFEWSQLTCGNLYGWYEYPGPEVLVK